MTSTQPNNSVAQSISGNILMAVTAMNSCHRGGIYSIIVNIQHWTFLTCLCQIYEGHLITAGQHSRGETKVPAFEPYQRFLVSFECTATQQTFIFTVSTTNGPDGFLYESTVHNIGNIFVPTAMNHSNISHLMYCIGISFQYIYSQFPIPFYSILFYIDNFIKVTILVQCRLNGSPLNLVGHSVDLQLRGSHLSK